MVPVSRAAWATRRAAAAAARGGGAGWLFWAAAPGASGGRRRPMAVATTARIEPPRGETGAGSTFDLRSTRQGVSRSTVWMPARLAGLQGPGPPIRTPLRFGRQRHVAPGLLVRGEAEGHEGAGDPRLHVLRLGRRRRHVA